MGQTSIRELVSIWGWEIDFKPLEKMEKKVESLKESIKHVLEVGAAAATSLFEMARETAFAGSEAEHLAKQTGIGVEMVQGLGYAAKQAGVQAESFAMGLTHLSRNMLEAFQGSEQARNTFFMVGTSATDSLGKLKPMDQMLMDVAERFKAMPDGPRKMALATELLGRAGDQLIPLLDKGAGGIHAFMREAYELGIVQSEAAVKADVLFKGSLLRLQGVLVGLRNTVGVKLVPAITDLMKKFMAWIAQNRVLLQQKITEFVGALAKITVFLWQAFMALLKVGESLTNVLGGLEHVLNLVAFVMAAIVGYKVYATFAALIPIIHDVAAAMGILSLSMWEITLVVAAIVAGIGLLYLAFDDVITYIHGGDSLLGRAIDGLQEVFSSHSPAMMAIRAGLIFAFGPLGMAIDMMGELGMFNKMTGNKGRQPFKGFGGGSSRGRGATSSWGEPKGISASWAPPDIAAGPSTTTSSSQQTIINQRFDVSAPISIGHGDPKVVHQAMDEWHGKMMRRAANELVPSQRGAQ